MYVEQEELLPRIIFDQKTKCIVNNEVLISLDGKKRRMKKKGITIHTTGKLTQYLCTPAT
jgi:hypothetical protein